MKKAAARQIKAPRSPSGSNKPCVAVLAVLSSLEPTYSVAGVVLDQLRLLRRKGHEVVLITTDDFKDFSLLPDGVEVKLYPRFHGEIIADKKSTNFETYVHLAGKIIGSHLEGCSVCITHDVIFIKEYLPVNWAMRKAASAKPSVRWLHWIHSGPSGRPSELPYPLSGCYNLMPNANLVYVNRTDVPKVAEMFAVPEAYVRVVHNFVDYAELLEMHPISRELIDAFALPYCDCLCIYPTRIAEAKQINRIISLLGSAKKLGYEVKLVVCNSYSNAETEKNLIKDLIRHAEGVGLKDGSLIFTSEFSSTWAKENKFDIEIGVPRKVVLDLMRLSDIFVLPSISEACSIIMLEAALCKNLMVLNEDLLSLHEFGGQKVDDFGSVKSIYMSFGSITRPIVQYNPSEEAWLAEHAVLLMKQLGAHKSLQFFQEVRRHHSPDFVYANQLGPLLA